MRGVALENEISGSLHVVAAVHRLTADDGEVHRDVDEIVCVDHDRVFGPQRDVGLEADLDLAQVASVALSSGGPRRKSVQHLLPSSQALIGLEDESVSVARRSTKSGPRHADSRVELSHGPVRAKGKGRPGSHDVADAPCALGAFRPESRRPRVRSVGFTPLKMKWLHGRRDTRRGQSRQILVGKILEVLDAMGCTTFGDHTGRQVGVDGRGDRAVTDRVGGDLKSLRGIRFDGLRVQRGVGQKGSSPSPLVSGSESQPVSVSITPSRNILMTPPRQRRPLGRATR